MSRNIFKGCKIYFHPGKLGKKRLDLLVNLVTDNGGVVCSSGKEDFITHIVVEESCDVSSKQCEEWCQKASIVSTKWLSQSLKDKKCLDVYPFLLTNCGYKRTAADEDDILKKKIKSPGKNRDRIQGEEQGKTIKAEEHEKYICTQASSSGDVSPRNQLVIAGLQKLAETYRSQGDSWRSYGYEKAISAIRRLEKDITSYEEAVGLEGIGPKMAEKVMEIITTGKLRKIEEVCDNEKSKVFELFNNVWGAGPSTVEAWYTQGFRTLEDLESRASLTNQQRLGLKYYNEIQDRMSRQEVEEICSVVSEAAYNVEPSLSIVICGSYRRGKATCGDVDIVIIRPDNMESRAVLGEVLNKLRNSDFITDDLVSSETSGNQRKYLGFCKLPGENRKHRRLDIFVVPQSETATAVMHYTGSALFNRSIRLLAARKGMHLSEHSLSTVVVRQGMDAHNSGVTLDTPTEESIFDCLGIEYRPPEERDH